MFAINNSFKHGENLKTHLFPVLAMAQRPGGKPNAMIAWGVSIVKLVTVHYPLKSNGSHLLILFI